MPLLLIYYYQYFLAFINIIGIKGVARGGTRALGLFIFLFQWGQALAIKNKWSHSETKLA